MPFGLVFHKAVLWHNGEQRAFRNLTEIRRDQENLRWDFRCFMRDGFELEAALDGCSASMHRLPYVKTHCRGTLEVTNNSLARATLCLRPRGGLVEKLETTTGAVLDMGGPGSTGSMSLGEALATMVYADGLNAIPTCVPGTSKSASGSLVMQYRQFTMPSWRFFVQIAVWSMESGISRFNESTKLQVQRPV